MTEHLLPDGEPTPWDTLEAAASDLRELVEFSGEPLRAGLERAASRLEDLAGAARYRHLIGADLPMAERRRRALGLLDGAPRSDQPTNESSPS